MIFSEDNVKSKTSDRMDEYIGNNKKYSISENKHHVRIIGNGNKVHLTTNTGTLEIIGNSTNVRIMNNCGSLCYTGNNGKILLSDDSSVKSVKYVGSNGSIKLVPRDELLVKKAAKVRSPLPLQTKQLSHDDCNNLFDRKFGKFTNNSFSLNNVPMPNMRGFQVNLSDIKIERRNIVINRT